VNAESRKKHAVDLLESAYGEHLAGNVGDAIRLYHVSLAYYPTAEAHAYLGWSYSFQGRIDDAIAECKKAISVDPDLGNSYNDIGSYLIHQGRCDEAEPWLLQALDAKRYAPRHYPHYNLGRIYRARGLLRRAIDELEKALSIEPGYTYAIEALAEARAQLN
jgi:Tfp pilus assembly protein PilF